ncbi:hypothetical protein [Clostridium muellerianum]|uniref:hypothetical protein n=1 Tax=Clostridium muellerianum TaxID=2716538 RepID=UPI001FAE0D3D|nr:hypothetical protein [Clostridium muellerianum]
MGKNKKTISVLSTAAIAGLILSAVSTPASAKATLIDVNGKDKKVYEYNYDDLKNSAVAAAADDTSADAKLYKDFLSRKDTTKAYFDDVKKGYVDFASITEAIFQATTDKPFDFKTYMEATSTPTTTVAANPVTIVNGVVNVNGKPESDTADLTVSSVSAITDTKLSVKLSAAVDDAAATNFSIAGCTVNSATLTDDKTEVKLDVTGLQVTKDYTVKATGLKVSGKVQPDVTKHLQCQMLQNYLLQK